VHAAGLLLELRALYVKAEQAGATQDDLKSWPACVRKDALAKTPSLDQLAQAIGGDLASAPLSDAMSWVVGPFCTWLVQASKQKSDATLQEKVWPALHRTLFPEKASPTAEAQGLRAFAEIASQLREAGLQEARSARAAALLAGLLECMPRGLSTLFRALGWKRAQAHPAALFAQGRIVEALGNGAMNTEPQSGGKKKKKQDGNAEENNESLPITDDMRLSILGALQSHQPFCTSIAM
jgi:hypothetical protein